METSADFEDLLDLLNRHAARYLIVGGLAFIFHAKPRYTKDIDIWIGPKPENLDKANQALADFGSTLLLNGGNLNEITQLGVAPNRIDLLLDMQVLVFEEAWPRRVEAPYGRVMTHWIGLEDLLKIKASIDNPRHQEDARILRMVMKKQKKH